MKLEEFVILVGFLCPPPVSKRRSSSVARNPVFGEVRYSMTENRIKNTKAVFFMKLELSGMKDRAE